MSNMSELGNANRNEARKKTLEDFVEEKRQEFVRQHPEYQDKSREEINQAMQLLSEELEKERKHRLKEHLEFFSDAVIAIIMTIIVLEIPIPGDGESYQEVLTSIGIFMVSFFIVGDFWLDHHRMFDGVKAINERILLINFVFMAFLSLIPLFTKWMMVEPSGFAVVNYGTVFLLASLSLKSLQYLIIQEEKEQFSTSLEMFQRIIGSHVIILLITNGIIMVFGYFHPEFGRWWYAILPIFSLFSSARKTRKDVHERLMD